MGVGLTLARPITNKGGFYVSLNKEIDISALAGAQTGFALMGMSVRRIQHVTATRQNRSVRGCHGRCSCCSTGPMFAGVRHEQVYANPRSIVPPRINNVRVDTLDAVHGIYRLTISRNDCTLDGRANPFFWFKSKEGFFDNHSVWLGSVSVNFTARVGGTRSVTVGVGDNLGQIARQKIEVAGARQTIECSDNNTCCNCFWRMEPQGTIISPVNVSRSAIILREFGDSVSGVVRPTVSFNGNSQITTNLTGANVAVTVVEYE